MTGINYRKYTLPLIVFILLGITPTADAHPLGNSSVTHFSVLWVLPDRLEVDLLLDIAEMPSAIIEQEEIDVDKDAFVTKEETQAWFNKKVTDYESLIKATIDGKQLKLKSVETAYDPVTGRKTSASKMIFMMPGFGNMPTYKLLIRYVAKYPKPFTQGQHTIYYEDTTYADNIGLRRIILQPTGSVEILPPHPEFYDPDLDPMIYEQYDPSKLPDERSATIKFRIKKNASSAPAAASVKKDSTTTATTQPAQTTQPHLANAKTTPATQPAGDQTDAEMPQYASSFLDPRNDPAKTNKYYKQADQLVGMIKGEWRMTVFIMITLMSFGWGAAHALMPGHAKTLVAAYLISQKGTYRHAILLAIVVTVTHTALVVTLGLVIWAYQRTNPTLGANLQTWLGIVAGILVAGMGCVLIWRSLTGRITGHRQHDHDHHHHHRQDRPWYKKLFTHSHPETTPHSHNHDHKHDHHHEHRDTQPVTNRTILVLGITGGIVPCPTATIIMLLGIGAREVAGALYAVCIFSLGLALTLMIIGFLALSSRHYASKLLSGKQRQGELSHTGRKLLLRIVPALSGAVVFALGAAITANYISYLYKGIPLFKWLG